ncbi:hypothetical protein CORC01_03485 [Colletotrichum orchidophilum]|uniref:Uncharacterized protein n=1 Tax=Colletotrichum orchidophilum TaxID=1209926 RepID=A0A1G4BIC6_9PEZI|nr:uncharacterized protein CORC01_03485 [Colletotrichum orchidophilum]OHF01171.1 hypothetical protein CORC01_03485 [Colletotrichum orchidophilum]
MVEHTLRHRRFGTFTRIKALSQPAPLAPWNWRKTTGRSSRFARLVDQATDGPMNISANGVDAINTDWEEQDIHRNKDFVRWPTRVSIIDKTGKPGSKPGRLLPSANPARHAANIPSSHRSAWVAKPSSAHHWADRAELHRAHLVVQPWHTAQKDGGQQLRVRNPAGSSPRSRSS